MDGLPIYRAGLAYAQSATVLLGSYRATILAGTYPGWPQMIPGELLQWGANFGYLATADAARSMIRFFLVSGSLPADGTEIEGLSSEATCKVAGVTGETRWLTEVRSGDEVSLDGESAWHAVASITNDAKLVTSGLTVDAFGAYGVMRSWTPFHGLARMAAGESGDPHSIWTRNLDRIDALLHAAPLYFYSANVTLSLGHAGSLVVMTCASARTLTLPDADRAGIGWYARIQNKSTSSANLTIQPLGTVLAANHQAIVTQIGRDLGGVSPTHGWIVLAET